MGFEWPYARIVAIGGSALALTGSGGLLVLAWQNGMFASILGLALSAGWLILTACWAVARRSAPSPSVAPRPAADGPPLGALFDQIPLPLLRIDRGRARAINRASRSLFATDDRLTPTPAALLDPLQSQLRYEGRSWRIERIAASDRSILILIDVEAERRAAAAHADNEMIDILGHELLNGLSPIVSLADSALVAAERSDARLPGILATLARRVEGLERFTRAYRTLARLPEPVRTPFVPADLADDLGRLFAERFAGMVTLSVDAPAETMGACDRDQMTQAIWALLQNAAEAALAGSVTPTVTLVFHRDETGLRIAVGDTGSGVAMPERTRIFRPFHTTKADGSGIGLTLARRIARAHGGDLKLLAIGVTTFEMTIPGP
ncbi:HAMP domain-containing histidine kinase [Sphingomonas sanguinis]|uniref:sensor histidine kinase n=1 Tax=Sphingomonas sp. LC-1 TaxID=3110957 RepID=UPI0021BACD45|nr:HAMP domain-containing sensor histidine kinase [Sphingomonas sp. LC-1]MCT8003093.1 HAMP domain-containing histidine kinase [Sphingomonas sp. LC-1]